MLKEKLMIAEKKECRFIIIPSDEADEAKKDQTLDIEIFAGYTLTLIQLTKEAAN